MHCGWKQTVLVSLSYTPHSIPTHLMVTNIFKSTKSDEFYIQTADKYYFPGDNIKGNIIFDVSKPVPTRHIIVSLESIIEVGGRSTPVFSPQSVFVAKGPEEGKVYELEAMRHSFPFKITIPSSCSLKIPSSLKIKDIVKVAYRLTAIHNRNFTLEKARIATPKIINILEMIDVHEEDYLKTYHDSKEFALTGETREVKVSTIIAKRAAVKHDSIPIAVTIRHIGVMVRDKAIKAQLLRYVHYGRNKAELFGPVIVEEVVTNIEISGPTSFTKTFNMKLPVNASCPTVDASGESFGIEYMIRVIVNLNEENPHRPEDPHDIVTFNMPFTVGTHPKLTFNIDDDGEEEEMKLSDNASEDDIAELIEGLDVGNDENGSNTDTTPVKEEEVTGSNFLAKASYPPASAKLDILPPIVMTASVSETINNSSTNGYPKMPNALGRRKSANWVVPTPMGQSPPTNTFPGQYPPTMLPAGTTPRPFPSRPLYPQAVNHYPPRPSPQFTPQIPYPRPDTYRPQDAYPPQDTYRPQSTFPGMMPPPSVSFPSENAFPTMQFPVPNPDGYGSTPVSSYAVFNYNAYPQHQNHPNAFN